MTDNKTIQDLRGTLKHTPQPSPQSYMVAVPREVIAKAVHTLEGYNLNGFHSALIKLLQPYTKGE